MQIRQISCFVTTSLSAGTAWIKLSVVEDKRFPMRASCFWDVSETVGMLCSVYARYVAKHSRWMFCQLLQSFLHIFLRKSI